MAFVFLAEELHPRRRVALKVLDPQIAAGLGPDRFLREVDVASQLAHPHILPIFAAGEADGLLYYAMPYVEGESLRDRLDRDKRLPLDEVLRITREVADALAHAHAQGVVHRDIKPGNILLQAGHGVVADFGIARAITAAAGDALTTSGFAIGTPAYMSPEQARGGAVDARSDIYSLGRMTYEMLAGEPPPGRAGDESKALLVACPNLSRFTVRAVETAMAADPADRFTIATDFAAALGGVGPKRHWRSRLSTRRRTRAVLTAVSLAALTLLVVQLTRANRTSRFGERDWILVADFEGPADDIGLADAVRELTTAEFNQSRFLSTLPRQQLNATMRLAGMPDSIRVGPELARELALRSAVRAVLVGSISRLGRGSYSIVLHVVDAEDGTPISSATAAASDSTLIASVQRVAREIRKDLGEHRSEIESTLPLYQVATPSFEAFRRYIEGVRLQTRGDGRGSNRLLREALALDPGFAAAWFTIGWNYLNDRMLDSARWAFSQAMEQKSRLSELQRYRLEADVAYAIQYDIPAAIRAYDLFLARAPRSWAVHNNRGNYLLALGRYEDALESFTRAVEAHPFGPRQAQIQLLNRVATLIALGRLAEAERAGRDLAGPFATYANIMAAVAVDRWVLADSLATGASAAPSSPGWLRVQATAVTAASQAARGRVQSADQILAQAGAGTSPDVARWFYRARLLLALAAERELPAMPPSLASDSSPPGLVAAGLSAVMRKDSATARRALGSLREASSPEIARLGNGPLLIATWMDANAGRWSAAAALLNVPASRGENDTALLDRVGSLTLRWFAAQAYALSGKPDSAIALLELVVKPERMPGNEFALRGLVVAFAHRRLAGWYTARDRPREAMMHWQAFLDSVTDPDTEMTPLVHEARRELQRLKTAA